jgi:hypothetical protein
MTKREDPELRVFDVMQPLPSKHHVVRPMPKMKKHAALTREETLKALRETKGGESVIKSIPRLIEHGHWIEEAYWGVSETRGAAVGGTFLWDCDFPGITFTMFDGYANGFAYFAGAEDLGGLIPPQTLTGRVWCHFETLATDPHLFVARVQTYPDQYYGPDYQAYAEFGVDQTSFGSWNISSGEQFNLPFVVNLSAGPHRFYINQVIGALFFEGLTAYRIPLSDGPLNPAPALP